MKLVERTVALLATSGLAVRAEHELIGNRLIIELPRPDGADYRFALYFHDDGHPQISALLRDDQPSDYFWYCSFPSTDASADEDVEHKFYGVLRRLVTRPSRIVQQFGLLSTTILCEVEQDGRWQPVGPPVSSRRWPCKLSAVRRRRRTFGSPPPLTRRASLDTPRPRPDARTPPPSRDPR